MTARLGGLLCALALGVGCGRAVSASSDAATIDPGAGGQGGAGVTPLMTSSGQSPGAIEIEFGVDGARSFCDAITACEGPQKHLTFLTASGVEIDWASRSCMHIPSPCQDTCLPPRNTCLPAPCVPSGETFTGSAIRWDGLYHEEVLCDTTTCLSSRFVPPGHYVVRGCATPGTLSHGDASDMPTCTPTGPEECVTASFELPASSPSPIMLQLPSIDDPSE